MQIVLEFSPDQKGVAMSDRISDLPLLLQQYVRGEVYFPNKTKYKEKDILLARKLRKQYFRNLQATWPGLQYDEHDYFSLMQNEIMRYGKVVLTPYILATWQQTMEHCPRLAYIYNNTPLPRVDEWDRLSQGKRDRLILTQKHIALRTGFLDPRTLGEMEKYCNGRVFYGMPHWRNYDPS